MIKYGVILGRFQPFHLGHESIIHEIVADGLMPLIIIGSCNKIDVRNPYSAKARTNMIRMVFPGTTLLYMDDFDSWDEWWLGLTSMLGDRLQDTVFYVNHKIQDRQSFTFNGRKYDRSFYTDVIEDEGYTLKQVTYPKSLGLDRINATDIRANLEANKHYLDSRVYNFLKSL